MGRGKTWTARGRRGVLPVARETLLEAARKARMNDTTRSIRDVAATPAASRPGRRLLRTPKSRGAGAPRITPWFYLLVPLGFLLIFTYIPVVNLFRYSVSSWDGVD